MLLSYWLTFFKSLKKHPHASEKLHAIFRGHITKAAKEGLCIVVEKSKLNFSSKISNTVGML